MNNFENENNINLEGLNQPQHLEEKKAKKNIAVIILGIFLVLVVGIVSGFYILKGLNNGVKENSFMHSILSKSGLLLSENTVNNDLASDNDYASDSDYIYASDSNTTNQLIFIQEKNGCNYYYYINENGDYLYYYSYTDDIYNYYASDSNGNYMYETYNDPVDPIYDTVPDFTKMTLEEIENNYINIEKWVEILYVPNSLYEDGTVYYQSKEVGTELTSYDYSFDYGTIIVNKAK